MEPTWKTTTSIKAGAAYGTVIVENGSKIEFKTAPGDKFFDETCPAGKKWTINISLYIEETDA